MGGKNAKRLLGALMVVASVAAVGAGSASAAITPNPWLTNRFLNIAHQGGELEAPSNTMYAFKSAVAERGADELELDVNVSLDGQVMVIHNGSVDGTTEGTGNVRALTAAQLQALDAGYDFQYRTGQYSHDPTRDYPFRGIRTGAKPPPAGYTADDFRIPTMREVLNAFPTTPINIEIKVPTDPEGLRIADALAALLNEPQYASRRDIVVVSFKQAPLERFHQLAPNVYLAPSEDALLQFAANQPLVPDPVIFEVPTSYDLMGTIIDVPDLLLNGKQAHASGYAVDVFLDADEETDTVYGKLIGQGVDGIMSGAPGRLASYLCRADIKRPDKSKRCASQSDPPVTPFSSDFSLTRVSLAKALKNGLPVKVLCSTDCTIGLKLEIGAGTAKRAGLGKKRRSVGQMTVHVTGGSKNVKLHFTRNARKGLDELEAFSVTVKSTPLKGEGTLDSPKRRSVKLARVPKACRSDAACS